MSNPLDDRNKISQWISKRAEWNSLQIIGQNRAVKTSTIWLIVVPIAATLMRQIESPVNISIFGDVRNIDLSLPFNWYCFYGAALFFAIGGIVFSCFCPQICRFTSFSEFYQLGHGTHHLCTLFEEDYADPESNSLMGKSESDLEWDASADLIHSFKIAGERSSAFTEDDWRRYIEKLRDEGMPGLKEAVMKGSGAFSVPEFHLIVYQFMSKLKREELGDLFAVIRSEASVTRTFARHTCLILFSIGFLLLFYVFAGSARTVSYLFLQDVFGK